MNPTNPALDFDLTHILAMPIEGVTYTPRNIRKPEGASEVAILTENERRLFHFMVSCKLSEQSFQCESQSCYLEYKKLLYTSRDSKKLYQLKQQVEENNISGVLFEQKTEAAEQLFWSAVKIRINSVIPMGRDSEFAVVVYGDNKIGLTRVNPGEKNPEE